LIGIADRGDIYLVAFDLAARKGRKVNALSQALMDEVLAKMATLFV